MLCRQYERNSFPEAFQEMEGLAEAQCIAMFAPEHTLRSTTPMGSPQEAEEWDPKSLPLDTGRSCLAQDKVGRRFEEGFCQELNVGPERPLEGR